MGYGEWHCGTVVTLTCKLVHTSLGWMNRESGIVWGSCMHACTLHESSYMGAYLCRQISIRMLDPCNAQMFPAVPCLCAAAKGPTKDTGTPAEQQFVRSLIELHDKYLAFVSTCFNNASLFHKSLKVSRYPADATARANA
jgi:hypothetical protein